MAPSETASPLGLLPAQTNWPVTCILALSIMGSYLALAPATVRREETRAALSAQPVSLQWPARPPEAACHGSGQTAGGREGGRPATATAARPALSYAASGPPGPTSAGGRLPGAGPALLGSAHPVHPAAPVRRRAPPNSQPRNGTKLATPGGKRHRTASNSPLSSDFWNEYFTFKAKMLTQF